MDQVVINLEAELQALNCTAETDKRCTIYRVLPWVRDGHDKDYDPRIISIGPYHRDKGNLKPMEQLKLSFLKDLLNRKKQDNDPQQLLHNYTQKARELEGRARSNYSPPPLDIDGNTFVRMMVLDGCFLVEFLIKMYYESNNVKIARWNLPQLRSDLLLFENQIPFFVLRSLFDLSNFGHNLPDLEEVADDVPITFLKLAVSYVTCDRFESVPKDLDPRSVHHLLHLHHLSLKPSSSSQADHAGYSCWTAALRIVKKVRKLALRSFFWLLSFILYCRLPCKQSRCFRLQPASAPRMFPCATELIACGIKFRKTTKRRSSMSLLDITFSRRDGVMEMVVLVVQDHTACLFRNLIAFEQCCPASGSHFTSYMALLNNLITTPADVAALRECGVVESKVANNKELIGMFSQLHKGAYINFDKHHFAGLFRDVKLYSEDDYNQWKVGLKRDYFASPWAIISVFAAIILLALTLLQTFYTVYPYYRPSEN